ncbi:hypothetical protein, partial [Methylobacterium crusticola]|uniref:hypothetical protein n=1 Tax=Methylobacterium crusticola TaxID=1697972 RepID=UPI001EE1ABC1
MKSDRIPDHLYWNAFENAKWILTDKKSGEVSEYNYSEMSKIVKDAYNQEELNPQNVIVRYLHQVGCGIARPNKRDIVGVRY